MLPGKIYKPEDFVRIAWRYRWYLVVPAVACLTAGVLLAYMLPERYQSSALIQVVPQRVPESYVRTTVTARVEDRLESVRQLILSRTKLESIIREFDLYRDQRAAGLMEDIVNTMREVDVKTEMARGDSFRVSYTSDDPRVAMRVTERLASLFIEENLRDRALLAESSSQFLEGQLTQARVRLEETEKKLAAYRQQYGGQLPDQVASNLQAVASAQLQIQQISESINRDRDQRIQVQRQISDLAEAPPDVTMPPAAGTTQDDTTLSGATAAERLAQARVGLRNMQLRFTEEHPDVVRMKRIITELEAKADEEAQQAASPSAQSTKAPMSFADATRRTRLRELQSQVAAIDTQIAQKTREEGRLREIASQYQGRVEAAPKRESELIGLTRDYASINEQYQSLLLRNEDAKMAATLERRQGGEQFRLLDPARLPERPISPNRPMLIGAGLILGLGLGLGIVALFEYRDRSFRTDDDVIMTLALPVLAVIPRMISQQEKHASRRRRLLFSAAGAAGLMCAAAVLVWRFVR